MSDDTTSTGLLGRYSAPFWFALAANVFFFFSFQSTFPVLPRFIADVVLGRLPGEVGGEVGLATSVTALVAVFTRIPAGRLADQWGHRWFMLAGALCFALAPLVYAVSRGLPVLLVGRLVQGLGLGIFTTAFQALITRLAPEGRRGEALGLGGASTSVAFISAPLAGDWLAMNWGYTPLFQVSAVAGALSVGMLLLIWTQPPPRSEPEGTGTATSSAGSSDHPANPREPEAEDGGLRLALSQQGVRAGVLAMAALGIPFGAFITFLPLLAEERQIVGVGLVYSVYAGVILLAQPAAGWLTDRIGREAVILPGLAITALATVILWLDGSVWLFALAGVVFGLGGGLVRGGVDPLVQDSVPASLRGTAAGVQYTSFDFWIGVGTYPIGILANAIGYARMFLLTGVAALIGGGTLAVVLRRAARD